MKPENSQEVHLRTIAEMAIMRSLLMALCRQSPDLNALLEDFEQRVEEYRHSEEVRTLQKDHRLEHFASLYSRSIHRPAAE